MINVLCAVIIFQFTFLSSFDGICKHFTLNCNIFRFYPSFHFIEIEKLQASEISSTTNLKAAELQKGQGMAIIVHLLCFKRWILFVVFHVYVVSHVFTTEKHVSFIFQKVNLCVQLILIFRGCSFCLPKFGTCSSLGILISCDVKK